MPTNKDKSLQSSGSVNLTASQLVGLSQNKNVKRQAPSTYTRQVDQQTSRPADTIQLSQLSQKHKKTRLRLLLWIGVCIAILVGLIVYASIRAGGIQNLFQGDGNIITNTVNNVGSSITNPTSTPTPTPTIFTFEVTPINQDEKTVSQNQNTVVLTTSGDDTNIRIKKGTYVLFTNATGKHVGLEFSNGLQYRFEAGEQKNILFPNAGTFTYRDVIDSYLLSISGTVTVIN